MVCTVQTVYAMTVRTRTCKHTAGEASYERLLDWLARWYLTIAEHTVSISNGARSLDTGLVYTFNKRLLVIQPTEYPCIGRHEPFVPFPSTAGYEIPGFPPHFDGELTVTFEL